MQIKHSYLSRLQRKSTVEAQISIGKLLFVHKQHCFANEAVWKTYVRKEFGLSRERADELIRIGTGVTTAKTLRSKKRDSARRWRSRHNEPDIIPKFIDRAEYACRQASHYLDEFTISNVQAKRTIKKLVLLKKNCNNILSALRSNL